MSDETKLERPSIQRVTPSEQAIAKPAGNRHDEMFEKAQAAVLRHFREKNAPDHYGGAFEATGLIGNVVDINGINARLRHIVIRSGNGGESFDRDKLVELLKDIAVDAILGMINIADENWLGK